MRYSQIAKQWPPLKQRINEGKNAMNIKIQPDHIGLCGSCRHATVIKMKGGAMIIQCGQMAGFDRMVRDVVESCNSYSDRRIPTLYDMRQTAWYLETDADKRTIGFISGKEWRAKRKTDSYDPLDDLE